MSTLAQSLSDVRRRIAAAAERVGRSPDEVTLVAVTKNVPARQIEEAVSLGVAHIGENRVQEAVAKFPQLTAASTRHLIGSLQRNKVRHALEWFDLIQSVDRESLALEISRRAGEQGADVLLQVNVSGESQKHGVAPDQLLSLAQAASGAGNLRVRGLMTIAPLSQDPEEARPVFAGLRQLATSLSAKGLPRVDMSVLSMGMSNDFEIAVEEGATHVRVGSAIFASEARSMTGE